MSLMTSQAPLPMPQKSSKHYQHLQKKWSTRHAEIKKSVREKHKDAFSWVSTRFPFQQISAGSLGGLMLLTAPAAVALPTSSHDTTKNEQFVRNIDKSIFLVSDLSNKVPSQVRPLSAEEEERIAGILTARFGIKVAPELDGKRLNRTYGYIGAEQHLARYPGDTMGSHFDNPEDAQKYYSSGMAPGLGAWRHFADSRDGMTQKESDREKYYIAVQTFLAPGYHQNVKEYSEFFKYRKMLVVNAQNGKALVADIGDAGPAVWTGKQLGGSPEVMSYLDRVDGAQKGPVLYFFIDDPDDTVPLGPIEVQ